MLKGNRKYGFYLLIYLFIYLFIYYLFHNDLFNLMVIAFASG